MRDKPPQNSSGNTDSQVNKYAKRISAFLRRAQLNIIDQLLNRPIVVQLQADQHKKCTWNETLLTVHLRN